MTVDFLLPILAMFTMLCVIVYAIISKEKTERRKEDDSIPKSSLARDAPDDRKAP